MAVLIIFYVLFVSAALGFGLLVFKFFLFAFQWLGAMIEEMTNRR